MKRVLIIGGGAADNPALLKKLMEWANVIICADAGADFARQNGIKPLAVIGDFDSISKETHTYFSKQSEVSLLNIREQETTDMEKALAFTLSSGKTADIVIIGAGGTRSDHFLHTIGLMFKYQSKALIRIIDGENIISLKSSSFRENCHIGERISLIPYAGEVKNVAVMGLKYPLQGETLKPGIKESISNQAAREAISVNFDSGILLFFRDANIVISGEI